MKKQAITTYEQAVEYLFDVPRFTKKNTLEDTRRHLHKLGDPDRELKIIHVAGTNGKGSVCAYLRSVLEAAGYRVAVFTSPHLLDVRERFLVAGEMVSRKAFLEAFQTVYDSLDWPAEETAGAEEGAGETATDFYHPTFFEFLFFMAMLLFREAAPDYCILETGLGGRLDATNAVSHKELTVITRIGLDHQEYLGDTLEKVAGEKAGILQEGVPLVYTDSDPAVSSVFLKRAAELGCAVESVSKKDYAFLNFKNKTIDFSLYTRYYDYIRVTLRTIARYQAENAALAVRAAEVLDRAKTLDRTHILAGLESCFWAGRMEEVLPEVYVDGAHNEDGIRAFLETVREDGCDRTLLFSVVQDKDCASIVSQLSGSGLFRQVALAPLGIPRGMSAEGLQELFAPYPDMECTLYPNAEEALRALLFGRRVGERIYIAGSLYLVSEIKELLEHDQF